MRPSRFLLFVTIHLALAATFARTARSAPAPPDLKDKITIIVDDGLASGFTMLAAARSIKKNNPEKIVVAVPTASLRAIELLAPELDEIVCPNIRSGPVFAVADAYKNWYDLTDEEVTNILKSRG